MVRSPWRATLLVAVLLAALLVLATCGGQPGSLQSPLMVPSLTADPQTYTGQEVTVDGAYLWRAGDPAISVLAMGVSTLDNGLDAQPLGDVIWLEGFPAEVTENLHRPGDAVYGFVRVRGQFESGGMYGPNGQYPFLLTVTSAEAIEEVRRVEQRIDDAPADAGVVSLSELLNNPEAYNGQQVTTRGYYFWNSVIYVLSVGISTEEDGSSPQPLDEAIWIEQFPPDQSAQLNVGPNNSYVWGPVEVTGTFQTGGGYGKDGVYESIFFVERAAPLTP
jgi:hypothetical protein